MSVIREPILSIPRLAASNGKKDSKSWIVHILSHEWPLSAKEIHYRVQKTNGAGITYQGIHKSIRLMALDGVLQKTHSKYLLDANWVSGLRKFGEEVQSAFKGRRCLHLGEIAENSSVQLIFDSFIEFFYWIIEELGANEAKGTDGLSTFAIAYHPWPIVCLSKTQYLGLKQLFSAGEHYIACKGNSAMDKSLVSLWKNAGAFVKLGAECSKNCDMLVFDDFVIQLFIPSQTKNEFSRIFSASQRMNGKMLTELYKVIYEANDPVTVLASRNPALAMQIKQEVTHVFG
ncbi:MAG TPA: hypothetical protein VJI13_01420 [Candidatus Norongarragalinales archaeon]|nr:hypothetical protein [Candidatus Norongarragalinales archaeon]